MSRRPPLPAPPAEWAARFGAIPVRLRLNRNRHTLVSLRDQRRGPPVLSIHQELCACPWVLDDLLRFARERGGGRYPQMQLAMQGIVCRRRPQGTDEDLERLRHLERIGPDFDFQACLEDIHRRFFAGFPLPLLEWARRPAHRRLTTIRFGCYRARPQPSIRLNPRLAQDWVARVFVEHVLHHELIHHQLHRDRRRGEGYHNPRFRTLERSFPGFDLAMAWEAANLQRLLAPPDLAASMDDPDRPFVSW